MSLSVIAMPLFTLYFLFDLLCDAILLFSEMKKYICFQVMEENETEENTDEAVQVDTDEPEETVLVNGTEGEEQWGTNNEGTSPA
jgi:hypothetical protein